MFKKLLSLCLLLICLFTTAQENLIVFENDLKQTSQQIKGVFPIVDQLTDDIGFFVIDAKNIYGYLINADFEVTHKLSAGEKPRLFKTLIGSSIDDNKSYRVFLTNKKRTKFTSVNFSFSDNKSEKKDFEIESKDKFIQTINYKNRFYLITREKQGNSMGVYTFNDQGNPLRNTIDFGKIPLVNKSGKSVKLSEILTFESDIKKFVASTPNTIELTADATKIYLKGSDIIFTFDNIKNLLRL